MKNKYIKRTILPLFFFSFLFFSVFAGGAEANLMENIACAGDGKCTPDDFFRLAVNAAKWILGITGSLALGAFVVGGAMFLVSSGNSDTVNKGKQVLIGAVIGLVVVFVSWLIVQFVMFNILGYRYEGTDDWFKL
ncbi:hypothetical protein A2303_07400 [Candidatus Falkowbacteria bacterium RIFOXYB2_FULL_47_14]|uniref:TrbC/VIRB2 family protein n=1 Tax=Candidatus Falkowbacteria bacterium RIFOXYA2_FULL_47_19 TaxID=1797994 RepID=A0A1F5SHQ1_9BACT|nr:MAG: hypothetical protein A2227_01150 [Candidatus Falkowbacteria bacterium RIFOXYA2_FULL_47_19]OGF34972.1 MAG: hypothetical protein A2468_07105 [Candidatus Falkowbacteria bacterium RIFOXYC2_FULL_46_15]OGF43687.1 MAG: hypothetical protein A2303_07400 [Candidatus Falkowbacteria bacterium RIFOXYB2_FULL_47_14]